MSSTPVSELQAVSASHVAVSKPQRSRRPFLGPVEFHIVHYSEANRPSGQHPIGSHLGFFGAYCSRGVFLPLGLEWQVF